MGQLLTLMVFGDAITVNDDVDGEEDGATIPGPPGPGIRDPEIGCSRSDAAVVGGRQDGESDADGAGQRAGEHFRRDLSALESWSCVVHRHRTGLDDEAQRRPAGSSGNDEDPVGGWDPGGRRGDRAEADNDDDDDRRQLLDVMNVADRAARLGALRRYLAAAAVDCRAGGDDGKGASATIEIGLSALCGFRVRS